MKKFVCTVCGYVHEGNEAPDKCPQCGASKEKFIEKAEGKKEYACEHEVGVAKGLDEEVVQGLRDNFNGECCEVGMYLAMSASESATRLLKKIMKAGKTENGRFA